MAMLTPEQWKLVRYDLEHTDKLVTDICREHGTTPNTLRDRVRRWGWTPRRQPIPAEGPPPMPVPQIAHAPPALPTTPQIETTAALPADTALLLATAPPGEGPPAVDDLPTVERLQGAVVAVLANIEAIVAKVGMGRAHASENERAARALAALTRTLRELKTLQTPQHEPDHDDSLDDIDEFRDALARKIDAFVASHGGAADDAQPEGT
jgi:hypothetical protein